MSILDKGNELTNLRYVLNASLPSIYRTSLKYNLFRVTFPDEVLENTFGYVFFTKPDLNIFENGEVVSGIANRHEFSQLLQTDLQLFRNLQSSEGGGPFIFPLCNKATNFTPNDEIIKTRQSAETANDWKIMYGHRINDSRAANTMDISFTDDRNLNVYKTIKIWTNYINLVGLGEISPKHERIAARELDYAGSVYYFLTDETAENIIYYSKLIGVFPLNIPSSVLGWELGNSKKIEYSISFQYSFKDESPLVIRDFNKIVSSTSGGVDLLNVVGGPRTTWVGGAYIENNNGKLKLKFTE